MPIPRQNFCKSLVEQSKFVKSESCREEFIIILVNGWYRGDERGESYSLVVINSTAVLNDEA